MATNLKRVYLVCHEFSPEQGSECKGGWNIALELNKIVDLTVVAAETNQWGSQNYRLAVEKNVEARKLNILWISQPKKYKRPSNFGSNIFSQVSYFLRLRGWNRAVIKKLKNHQIDVLHFYNHISFRAFDSGFSPLATKIIIGPVSGVQIFPLGFLNFGIIYNCNLLLRSAINFVHRFLKRSAFQAENISAIFAVTLDDVKYFEGLNKRVIALSDMAQDSELGEVDLVHDNRNFDSEIRLLWVGRLDNLKCLDIILEVFSRSRIINSRFKLTVLGDGENFLKYERIIAEHKLNILLEGRVPFKSVRDFMIASDLMVHSSLKEAGSAVANEALSVKLPIMCHDAFGFSIHLDDHYVIKIPFISFETSVQGFQKELENIARNNSVLSQLRSNIKNHFMPTTWEDHAIIINKEYE